MSLPQILHLLKLVAAIVVTGSGSILAASLQGAIVLPASVTAVLTSIVSVGAGLGIASGGLTKPPEATEPPVKP